MDTNKQRLFFLCPSDDAPIGGNKKIYQQVNILNNHGFNAFVLHNTLNFRCSWFNNDTPIVYPNWPSKTKLYFFTQKLKSYVRRVYEKPIFPKELELVSQTGKHSPINSNDIIVIPEIWAFELISSIGNQPFVIFNQNAYLTFSSLQLPNQPFETDASLIKMNPYLSPSLLGVMVVSQNNLDYLQFAFPKTPIHRLRLAVDTNKFAFSSNKQKQIAYMPRKCTKDSLQVVLMLMERGNLKGWNFAPIHNKSENEVADILKNSLIFLNFSDQEGFALPISEAIKCGCHVIGYHGGGGKEVLRQPFGTKIETPDIIDFVKAVEEKVIDIDLNKEKWIQNAQKNAGLLRDQYSEVQEESDIISFWKSIL